MTFLIVCDVLGEENNGTTIAAMNLIRCLKARGYVHPAEIELEGISCLEAIACGKLTIVSDSKNAATKGFAIDDKCIFRNRDPKALAEVIDFWIDHPAMRHEYEQKCLESASPFDQNVCMLKMEEMMLEVANAKGRQ